MHVCFFFSKSVAGGIFVKRGAAQKVYMHTHTHTHTHTETERSAAALDVHVGHFSDPQELPGLAHFCEHMCFLGSKKYPNEAEYSQFLAAHGGMYTHTLSLSLTHTHVCVCGPVCICEGECMILRTYVFFGE